MLDIFRVFKNAFAIEQNETRANERDREMMMMMMKKRELKFEIENNKMREESTKTEKQLSKIANHERAMHT